MIESMVKLKKRLGFFYAELGLIAGKGRIAETVSRRLGTPVRLRPFVKGRGWGLKYLVLPEGASKPTHLVKAASRIIERRLTRDPAGNYHPYNQRFAREAEILGALAALGLGPSALLCEDDFFVREYVPGRCLYEIAEAELIVWLPRALEALEQMCDAGIFHTDPNAENVIVDPGSRRPVFIDSEVSVSGPALGTVSPERRLFCHERLLASLSWKLSGVSAAEKHFSEELLAVLQEFYRSRESLNLSPERAAALLQGEAVQRERPL